MNLITEHTTKNYNIWAWRPIEALLEYISEKYKFQIDIDSKISEKDSHLLAKLLRKEIDALDFDASNPALYLSLGRWKDLSTNSIVEESEHMSAYDNKLITKPISLDGKDIVPIYGVSKQTLEDLCECLEEPGGFSFSS